MIMTSTENGAIQYDNTGDVFVNFFSKAGSAFAIKKVGKSHTNEYDDTALNLFKEVIESATTPELKGVAMCLLFWLRDPRGGAGNRSAFRDCLKWLASTDPEFVIANINIIPKYGRWDDLIHIYHTRAGYAARDLWANAIRNGDGLACKWAGRKDDVLRSHMRLSPKEYRKMLVAGTKVVENKMCKNEWDSIEFPKVPSVAMKMYAKAFRKHTEKFVEYLGAVANGKAKINAGVLFPHSIIHSFRTGDKETSVLQWDALPNFLEGTDARIVAIADTSGSMDQPVAGGDVHASDVSQGLALYCSDRIGKDNPFYRKFLNFCDEANFVDWRGVGIGDVIDNPTYFNGAVGSTDICLALDTILGSAKMWDVPKDKMPNCLLIISDMQFNEGSSTEMTPVQESIAKWVDAGYNAPSVVYWDCTARGVGSPALVSHRNVAMVSGYSPSILKAVFSGDFSQMTPVNIMLNAIEKYVDDVVVDLK